MLNRVFIIVGLALITIVLAAFVVPRFIQWSDYRDRMEMISSQVLGADVSIRGDISFTLLPEPKLRFTEVVVGSLEDPSASVEAVEADFSLFDFLGDRYNITRLVLQTPVIDLKVDESGLLTSAIKIDEGAASSGVRLGNATIVDGSVRLSDIRSDENYVVDNIAGDLRLTSFSGPFNFQGRGDYSAQRYQIRFSTAAFDPEGNARLSASLRPDGGIFSVAAEGNLVAGMAPRFDGTLTYRQTPPVANIAGQIRGDMIFETKIEASSDQIVMSGYTLQPDENRPGSRLTGAASIKLGAQRAFDAVISGGVFSVPPRAPTSDKAADASPQPYDLVALLGELPAPLIPPLPGTIGVDLAEINLRSFSLRDVRVDAETDGRQWTISQFQARLPGETAVTASGTLIATSGRPAFNGMIGVDTQRLDLVSQLWREPEDNNPLFAMPASLQSKIILAGDALGFTDGVLTLDGTAHQVGLRIGFGVEPRLDIVGHFAALDTSHSAAVAALLPTISDDPEFGVSFPDGSFSLSAVSADLLALPSTNVIANGSWSPTGIAVEQVSADDFGGAKLDAKLALAGTLSAPQISGTGTFDVVAANAPALTRLLDAMAAPELVRAYVRRAVPAALDFTLGVPDETGAQALGLDGTLGVGQLALTASVSGPAASVLTNPISIQASLSSDTPTELTQQLGFGDAQIFPDQEPLTVSLELSGSRQTTFQTKLAGRTSNERLDFNGDLLFAADGELQGTGIVTGILSDGSALAEVIGANGLHLGQLNGQAQMHFEGIRSLDVTGIEGRSRETSFTGNLSLARTSTISRMTGAIELDSVDVTGLAVALAGQSGVVTLEGGVWPDGPIQIGDVARRTTGSIAVRVPAITMGGEAKASDARFNLIWDETRLRLAEFEADLGIGKLRLDAALCCAGALADKTFTGSVTLDGVPLSNVLPATAAATLDGVLSGAAQVEGSGSSIASILSVLSGEGNFSIADLAIQQLDPTVFTTVSGLDDVLTANPDDLTNLAAIALDKGLFSAPELTGIFTIAGGTARLANFTTDGQGGRLAGSINLALPTLGLSGTTTLSPLGFSDPRGLVSEDSSRIIARLSGTLPAPERAFDLGTLIDGIQVRANEIEVERLEQLQAEDEARQREVAAERMRLMQEQARRQAAELAARQASEAEASRQRAAAEAARQPVIAAPTLTPIQPETAPVLPNLDLPSPSVAPFQMDPLIAPPAAGEQF